jgi:hypothetical protein
VCAARFAYAYFGVDEATKGRDFALAGVLAVFLFASQLLLDADARRAQERHEKKVLEALASLEAKINAIPSLPPPARRRSLGCSAIMHLIGCLLRMPERT